MFLSCVDGNVQAFTIGGLNNTKVSVVVTSETRIQHGNCSGIIQFNRNNGTGLISLQTGRMDRSQQRGMLFTKPRQTVRVCCRHVHSGADTFLGIEQIRQPQLGERVT